MEEGEGRKKRGRRRREDEASVHRIGVRLSPHEHELLERIVAHFGGQHSKSDVVRMLIRRLGETLPAVGQNSGQ